MSEAYIHMPLAASYIDPLHHEYTAGDRKGFDPQEKKKNRESGEKNPRGIQIQLAI